MVVLSVAVCTKNGKALLSRQFVDTNRIRIEGLLAAFPKLISSDASKQHTFVETDNVRYVYLPLGGSLYLVLLTNKGSNIMEDLDTLRLLSKVVPDQCGAGAPISEDVIAARAFELLFAFDEVISAGGYREDVTLHTIRTNLEMESHEEKLAQMIKASKMAEAKEAAKRKAAEIRARHREEEAQRGPGGQSSKGGFGSADAGDRDSGYGGGGSSSPYGRRMDSASSSSAKSAGDRPSPVSASSSSSAAASSSGGGVGGKKGGMKLGAKGGAPRLLGGTGASSLMAEEGMKADAAGADGEADVTAAIGGGGAAAAVSAAQAAAAAASQDHASIVVEEKLTARVGRDGGVEAVEVKGMLSLTVADDAHARLRMGLRRGPGIDKWALTTHPNVNKAAFTSDGMIALKQPDRPFPVGAPLGVLRWRYAGTDESSLPITLNVWPEEGAGGSINVNIEYALAHEGMTLHDVTVTIPLAPDMTPKVGQADGLARHDTRANALVWSLDTVSADNATGSLEFTVRSKGGADDSVLFPVSLAFSSSDLLCPLEVGSLEMLTGDATLRYSVAKALTVDSYTVENA